MKSAILTLPGAVHTAVRQHLLPAVRRRVEEAAFVYATHTTTGSDLRLAYVEWSPILPTGFVSHSPYHLELSDEARAAAIKRAHDLGSCLVEFHSHVGPWPPRFSPSDLAGFVEFVPHVFWRLKNRPYGAIVVTESGFDGFVWTSDPRKPERLTGIAADGGMLDASALSPLMIDDEAHEH